MRPLLIVLIMVCTTELWSQSVVTGSFLHNGIERDYRLYIPAIYDPAVPVPLVFNLHGYGIENATQELYADFRPIADTANFIIAHPNGTIDAQGYRFWNTFGLPDIDDLGFISALIDTISANYSIDPDRVYSTGMSNGGMMTFELSCFLSERFAAIASVTGSMLTARLNACAPLHPMPVLIIHGTDDQIVPFEGGNGYVPIQDILDHWITYNICSPQPVITQLPDIYLLDGSTVEHQVYACADAAGTTVELFKINDGGHTWPGSVINYPGTNYDIHASIEVWKFFSRYSLYDISTPIAEDLRALEFTVAPNPSNDAFFLRFGQAATRSISVVNATGVQCAQFTSIGSEIMVHVDQPGLYLVTITEGAQRKSQRILKL